MKSIAPILISIFHLCIAAPVAEFTSPVARSEKKAEHPTSTQQTPASVTAIVTTTKVYGTAELRRGVDQKRQDETLSFGDGGSWTQNSELPVETLTDGLSILTFGADEKRQEQTLTLGDGGETNTQIEQTLTFTFSNGDPPFTQSDLPVITDTTSWGMLTLREKKEKRQTLSWNNGGNWNPSFPIPTGTESNEWSLTLTRRDSNDDKSTIHTITTPPLTRTSSISGGRPIRTTRMTTSEEEEEDDKRKRQDKTITVIQTVTATDDEDEDEDEETTSSTRSRTRTRHRSSTRHTRSTTQTGEIPVETVIVTASVIDTFAPSEFTTIIFSDPRTLRSRSRTQHSTPTPSPRPVTTPQLSEILLTQVASIETITLTDSAVSGQVTLVPGSGNGGLAKGGGSWIKEREETFVFGAPGAEETMVFEGGERVSLIEVRETGRV